MNSPPPGIPARFAIAVIGPGEDCSPSELSLAESIGREIAGRGMLLICGGLGGVMEAACRGAMAAGGTTVGILPGNDTRAANPYVSIAIATGIGLARNLAVVCSARAVIAVGGKYGTLTEIAYALKTGKPVIGLGTWAISRSTDARIGLLITAHGAVDAVEKAIAAAGGG